VIRQGHEVRILLVPLPPPSAHTAVVVTGASSGIGEAVARELAGRGHGLIAVARDGAALEALAAEFAPAQVDVEVADLADGREREALLERLRGAERTLDGLVNSAGTASGGRGFAALRQEREREIVAVNVAALHHLTRALLPAMVARGSGAVLNVGSIAGTLPTPGLATYSAAKAFVNAFTEALHAELRGTGVTATLVRPGPVRTPIWARVGLAAILRRVDPVFMDSEPVAFEAVDAMERGDRTVTPGRRNRAFAAFGHLTPRRIALPLAVTAQRGFERAGGPEPPR